MNELLKLGISILLICWLLNANAQVVLHGKVIDHGSGKGIPYASVQITNSAYGTACDDHGAFLLKIDPGYFNDSLKISCIGYSNLILSIQNLINSSNENLTIRLNPFILYLDEVKITSSRASPQAFLEEAISAIPDNFIQQPFNMEVYSKMWVQDSLNVVLFQIESIMLTHNEGYKAGSRTYLKILHKREKGTIPLPIATAGDNKGYFAYYPGFDIGVMDRIGWGVEEATVLNPKNYKTMKFRYAGVSIFDQDTLVAIEYGRRKKDSRYYGTIYIASNNLAIIKLSLKYGKEGNSVWEIIYKKVNGYYFPYSIKSKTPVYYYTALSIVDEIIVTKIETDNVVPLEKKYDQWYPKGVPYDEEYWNLNYPIKKIE